MPGLTSISGLISGMDTETLVDQLIAMERRPAYLLESKIAQNQLRLASYDALESSLQTVNSAISSLRRVSDFQGMLGSVSHENLLTANVSAGAPAGTYSLSVQRIAQNHQIVSQAFADSEDILGTGTVTLSLGGEEAMTLTLAAGENTLQDFVDAINDEDAGLSASLVQTSDGETPWQLIVTSTETGAEQLITVDSQLSGGTGLTFGSVGDVVVGSIGGTSTVTSGGNYTGNLDTIYTFTVTAGGTVGTDEIIVSWTDTEGNTGEITFPAGYGGTATAVHGGLTLSLGAGTLVANDNWTVETDSSSIQAAQDALVHFGSTGGGADPLEITSADNVLEGLISGVTLNLLAADVDQGITLSIAHDTEGIVTKVQDFVTAYNNLVKYFNAQFDYDEDLESSGVLLGDSIAMNVDSRIRRAVGQSVMGISTDLTHLSEIGVGTSVSGTLNNDGTFSVDESTLRDAISTDLDAVVNLLAGTGEATDEDIRFIHAGTETNPTGFQTGYNVRITQAATRGLYSGTSFAEPSEGSPLVVGSGNANLKVTVNGVTSKLITLEDASFTSGADLALALQNALNDDEDLGSTDVLVRWVDDGGGNGHVDITSKTYGSNSSVVLEDVTGGIYASIGLTAGTEAEGLDVEGYFMSAGTIETATGTGQILVGDDENDSTDGLSIRVKISAEELVIQGEDQGRIKVFSGIGDGVYRTLDTFLDPVNGILECRQSDMRTGIEDLEDQVEKIDERLEKRRERYLKEFIRMESLLSEMNNQSSMVTSMLGGL